MLEREVTNQFKKDLNSDSGWVNPTRCANPYFLKKACSYRFFL